MAVRTRAAYKATKNARYAANTSGDISSGDSADMHEDIADSALFQEDLIDDDTFATASPSTVPSSESVKAYVDAQVDGVGMIKARVVIPSASVLTGNATPVQMVAAPGVGKFIQPVQATQIIDFNTTAYATNVSAVLDINSQQPMGGSFAINSPVASIYTRGVAASWIPTVSQVENQPLNWMVSTGNPTAGDSDIIMDILYRIVDLP